MPQRRPKGQMWNVDANWKSKIEALMSDKGITRAEMSRRLGVSDAAITILFKPKTRQSRLVPDIHRVLGLPPPVQTVGEDDERLGELRALWPSIDDEGRKVLWGTARVLAKKKP